MKAIIYAGIGLFAAASIYGLADYYNTQKKGTLDKLYKEEDLVQEPVKINNTSPVELSLENNVLPGSTSEIKATTARAAKKLRLKRTISFDDFSRGKIVERVPLIKELPAQPIIPTPVKAEEPRVVEKEIPVETKMDISPNEPERKISLDMFSRAPLRKPVKKNLTKTVESKTIVVAEKQQ